MIDVNGKSIMTYTISNEDICDKVKDMVGGVPSTIPSERAFYSTDYGKISHKRILKICRDRFSAEFDSVGTGNSKTRALTFVKDIVEKIGKTFEIISEIKIVQPDEDEEGEEYEDMEKWDIPIPSQDRSNESEQNHTQDNKVGTMGRKYKDSSKVRDDNDKDVFLKYVSERKGNIKENFGENSISCIGNRPISVPTSQGNRNPFKCYHRGCEFETDEEQEYRRHGAAKHLKNPLLYPSKAELERYGLQSQGKSWEI